MIGRSWYVNEESLLRHKKEAEELLQIRNKEYAAQSARAKAALALEQGPVVAEAASRKEPVQIYDARQMLAPSVPQSAPVLAASIIDARPAVAEAPAVVPPISWNISYAKDERPLLPILEKNVPTTPPTTGVDSASGPVKSPFTRDMHQIGATIAMITVLGIGSVYAMHPELISGTVAAAARQVVASVLDVTRSAEDAIAMLGSQFSNTGAPLATASVADFFKYLFGVDRNSESSGNSGLLNHGVAMRDLESYPYYLGGLTNSNFATTPKTVPVSAATTIPASSMAASPAAGAQTSSGRTVAAYAPALSSQLSLADIDARIQDALSHYVPWQPTYTFISGQSSSDLTAVGSSLGSSILSLVTGGTTAFNGASLTVSGLVSAGGINVGGNASVSGNLSIGGSSDFSGNTTFGGTSTFGGNTVFNGTVGIGTSSPAGRFAVQGDTLISGDLTSVANINATGTITAGNLVVNGSAIFTGGVTTYTGDIVARRISAYEYLETPFIMATSTTATSTFGGSFAVGGNQFLVDHSTGFVGVGTSSPSAEFAVQGSGLFSGNLAAANITATGTVVANGFVQSYAGVQSLSGIIRGDDQFHQIVFHNGGNNTDYIEWGDTLANGGGHKFFTGGTTPTLRFQIADDGVYARDNFGVGTTSPGAKVAIANGSNATQPAFLVSTSTASATSTAFIIDNNGKVGIGTTTPSSDFAVAGSAYISENLTVGGNHVTLGGSDTDTLTVRSSINSSLVPNQNATYDLGSPSYFWKNGYIDNLTVNNLSAASTTIAGTSNDIFILNSDNASADLENSSLVFYRGVVVPNAILSWNAAAAAKRFEFNQSLFIQNATGSTTQPGFVLQGVNGQTADIAQVKNFGGTTLFNVAANGSVGVGTTTPAASLAINGTAGTDLLAIGSSTGQYFVVNKLGNVGIGTAAPTSLLTLSSAAGGPSLTFVSGTQQYADTIIQSQSPSNTNSYLDFKVHNSNSPYSTAMRIGSDTVSSDLVNINGALRINGFADATLSNINTYYLRINPVVIAGSKIGYQFITKSVLGGTQTPLTFDNAGMVGIGSTTPWGGLSVNPSGLGSGVPEFVVGSSTATHLIVDGGGKVGINTTNPLYSLHVVGSRDLGSVTNGPSGTYLASASFANTGLVGLTFGGMSTAAGSSYGVISPNASGDGILFNTRVAGVETARMTVANNGNIGIGTTTPSALLVLGGNGTVAGGQIWSNAGSTIVAKTNFITPSNQFLFGTESSSNLSLITGNTERVRIDTAGNVGIGTTSPSAKLAVTGSGTATGRAFAVANSSDAEKFTILDNGKVGIGTTNPSQLLEIVGGNSVTIHRSTLSTGLAYTSYYNDANNALRTLDMGYTGSAYGGSVLTSGPSGESAFITTSGAYPVAFGTNNTARMVIGTTGNVGIGTANPLSPLEIVRSAGNPSWMNVISGTSASPNAFTQFGVAANANDFGTGVAANDAVMKYGPGSFQFVASNASFTAQGIRLTITNGGNVGIGTTTPSRLLTVEATSPRALIRNSGTTGDGYLLFGDSASDSVGGIRYNHTTDVFGIRTNGVDDRLIVDASGNVGIGTTTPNTRLNIVGTDATGLYTENTAGLTLIAGSGNTQSLRFYTDDTNSMSAIQSLRRGVAVDALSLNPTGGNVGIGTTSPARPLSVQGSALVSGNIAAATLTATGTITASGNITTTADMQARYLGLGGALPGDLVTSQTMVLNVTGYSNLSGLRIGSAGQRQVYGYGGELGIATNGSDISFSSDGSGATRMMVIRANTGYVGIGTTSPMSLLSLAGNVSFSNGANRSITIATSSLDLAPAGNLILGAEGVAAGNYGGGNVVVYAGQGAGLGFGGQVNISGGNTPGSTASASSAGGAVNISGGNITSGVSGNGEAAGSININAGNTARSGNTFGGNITLLAGSATNAGTGGSLTLNPGSGSVANGNIILANLRGNVGIGTTSPSQALSVQGNLLIAGNVIASGYTATSTVTAPNFVANDSSATSTFAGGLTVGTTNLVVDRSTGKVGIGTASPLQKLSVATGVSTGFVTIGSVTSGISNRGGMTIRTAATGGWGMELFSDPNGNSHIRALSNGTANDNIGLSINLDNGGSTSIYGNASSISAGNSTVNVISPYEAITMDSYGVGAIQFKTNAGSGLTERMRINDAGNIGIGTTSPNAKLDVNGSIVVEGTNSYNFIRTSDLGVVGGLSSDNNSTITLNGGNLGRLNFGTTNNTTLTIVGGKVGIGTTTPSQTLSVQGNALLSGNLTAANLTATGTLTVLGGSSILGSQAIAGYFTATSTTATSTFAGNVAIGGAGIYAQNGAFAAGSRTSGTGVISASQAGAFAGGHSAVGSILASGQGSLAYGEGAGSTITASGAGAVALGNSTGGILSSGSGSLAGGYSGFNITSSGIGSMAWGVSTGAGGVLQATGAGSMAFGNADVYNISASNEAAFAGGDSVTGPVIASGRNSFAWGDNIIAAGDTSFSLGRGFTNSTDSSFMVGFSSTPTLTVNSTSIGIGTTSPSALLSVASSGGNSAYFAGNVGIGTNNPSGSLHIAGSNAFTSTGIFITNSTTGGKTWSLSSTGSSAGQGVGKLQFRDETSSANIMTLSSTGVGVSTTSPAATFAVGGDAIVGGNITLTRSGIGPALHLDGTSGSGADWQLQSTGSSASQGAGKLLFRNNTNGDVLTLSGSNVGIGTTTPSFPFAVVNGNTQTYLRNNADYSQLWVRGTNAGQILTTGNSLSIFGLLSTYSDGVTRFGLNSTDYSMLLHSGGNGLVVGTGEADPVIFGTNNVERARIDSSGNVGIGTTSPQSKLQVYGGTSDGLRVENSAVTAASGVVTRNYAIYGNLFFLNANNGYGVQGYAVNTDTSTGLRSLTSPSADSGTTPLIMLEASSHSTDAFSGITTVGTRPILGVNNFTTRLMTVTAAGNVGIGTTSPAQTLSVQGNTLISGNITSVANITATGTISALTNIGSGDQRVAQFMNSGGNGYAQIGTNNTNSHNIVIGYDDTNNYGFYRIGGDAAGTGFSVKDGGNVGIGTTSPATTLNVNGFARFDRSDNTTDIVNASSQIALLNPDTTANNVTKISFDGYDSGGTLRVAGIVGTQITARATNAVTSDIFFATNNNSATGAERMRITGAGNVGIGTTTPAGTLGVNGTAYINGNAIVAGNILPDATNVRTIGAASQGYNTIYVNTVAAQITAGNNASLNLIPQGFTGNVVAGLNDGGSGTSGSFIVTHGGATTFQVDRLGVTSIKTGSTNAAIVLTPAGSGSTASIGTSQATGNGSGTSLAISASAGGTLGGSTSGGNLVFSPGLGGNGGANGVSYFSQGNVGIGTTSPNAKLNVYSGAAGVAPNTASDDFVIEGSGQTGMSILAPNDQYRNIFFGGPADAFAGRIYYGGSAVATAADQNAMVFYTASGEKMRISSSGNVGIGNTNPQASLHILNASSNSTAWFSSGVAAGATSGAGISAFTTNVPTAANQRLGFYTFGFLNGGTSALNSVAIEGWSNQAWTPSSAQGSYLTLSTTADGAASRTERLRIAADGNVGIGTSSPATALHVEKSNTGGGVVTIANDSSSGYSSVDLRNNGNIQVAGFGYGNTSAANSLLNNRFYTYTNGKDIVYSLDNGSTGSMILTSAGNLGIGTTTPTSKLSVEGDFTASGLQGFEMTRTGVARTAARFSISNVTNSAGVFLPAFTSVSNYSVGGAAIGGYFAAQPVEDDSSSDTAWRFDGRTQSASALTTAAIAEFTNLNSPIVRIMANGTMGIGTSTPRATLGVQGNGLLSGNLFVGGSITSTSTLSMGGSGTFTSSAGPSVQVQVSGASGNNVILGVSNQSSGLVTGDSLGDVALRLNNGSNKFYISEGATPVFTILGSNANVGIGSTSPTSKLVVSGGGIVNTPGGITRTATSSGSCSSMGKFYPNGKYLYSSSEDNCPAHMAVWDVSNPYAPTYVSSVAAGGSGPKAFGGKYIYSMGDNFQIYDISNPYGMYKVGEIVHLGIFTHAKEAKSMALSGRYVYVVADTALYVIDVADPTSPKIVGSYTASDNLYGMYLSGKYLYLAADTAGLVILDVSNPKSPLYMGTYDTSGNAKNVVVSGKYAYVADTGGQLAIINVSNPQAPSLTSTLSVSNAFDVAFMGRYIAVARGGSGVTGVSLVDVQNPLNPFIATSYLAADMTASSITVSGKYIYVGEDLKFHILDTGGVDTPSVTAGTAELGAASVLTNMSIGDNLYVGGGIIAGTAGISSRGGLSVYAATTSVTQTVATFMGGNVGVGTTTPWTTFAVNGTVSMPALSSGAGSAYVCMTLATGELSTSTTACNPSSIRFKDNVQNSTYGLSQVLAMRPVTYTYKPEMKISGNQVGFIAEEMETIVPEVVGHDAQGIAANIDYAKLAPVIVNAIKDMQAAINTQNAPTSTVSIMIDGVGNVGIGMGSTTYPQYKLAVQGDVAATSFVNISTRDAKTDISYLDDTAKDSILDTIGNLGIAQYRYKTENQADPLRLGLIAEEAPAAVLAVGGKGVDVYKLSTYTLAGVQAQQRQIKALKEAQASTQLTVSSTTKAAAEAQITIFDLVGLTKTQGDMIAAIQTRLDALTSRVDSLATSTAAMGDKIAALQSELSALRALVANNAASANGAAATTTVATTVATSTVQSVLSSMGEWIVSRLTASIVIAERIEAKTVAVSQGFDIVDQASGVTWCVTIKNGEWSKVPWACGTPASVTAAALEGATQTTPINQASTVNVPQNDTPSNTTMTGGTTTDGGSTAAATTTAATSTSTTATSTEPVVTQSTQPAETSDTTGAASTTPSTTPVTTATSTAPVASTTPVITTTVEQPSNGTTTSPTASTTITISMENASTASTTTP